MMNAVAPSPQQQSPQPLASRQRQFSLQRSNSAGSLPSLAFSTAPSLSSTRSVSSSRRQRLGGFFSSKVCCCCKSNASPLRRLDRRLFVARTLFLGYLVMVAAGVGISSFRLSKNDACNEDDSSGGEGETTAAVAAIVSITAILSIAIFFFVYDCMVRQEIVIKKDLLEAKRRFMRFVSHEVRTPLNAVCMGLDVMQSDLDDMFSSVPVDSPDGTDHRNECINLLQSIRLSAMSAVDVLNTMLNYDKVERNALSLDIGILPAWDLVETTVREFTLSARNKRIDLSWHVRETGDSPEETDDACGRRDIEQGVTAELSWEAQNVCFLGDAARLLQVLRNLISNAIKFTPAEGSIRVEASVSRIHRPARWQSVPSLGHDARVKRFGDVRLTVTDTGAGMTEDQIARVFREGSQFNANELQAIEGSGLGMYISKEIMKRHQGSLSAESEGLGEGTTFTITLPLYSSSLESRSLSAMSHEVVEASDQGAAEDTAVSLASPDIDTALTLADDPNFAGIPTSTDRDSVDNLSVETTSTTEDLKCHFRVLLVEDVASNRKLLRRLLERNGHSCVEAENGQMAVDLYRQNPSGFDTILIDSVMPIMDGPTAVESLRSMGCDLVIIGVTGNALREDVEHFCKCGVNTVVPKPLHWRALEEAWRVHGMFDTSKSASRQNRGMGIPRRSRRPGGNAPSSS